MPEIEIILTNRIAKGRNIDDLQNELKRYKDLEHHLPAIVQRLKKSLSVDISEDKFETGIKQILESIQKMVVAIAKMVISRILFKMLRISIILTK